MAARRSTGTRARDSDRNDTCAVLDSALADGQLSSEEHRQRVAVATKATTLGELKGLTNDLQTNAPGPRADPQYAWRLRDQSPRFKAAAVGALVVVAVAIAWGVNAATRPPTPDSGEGPAQPAAEISIAPTKETAAPPTDTEEVAPTVLTVPEQLHTAEGMTVVLEQMRQRFGDTTGIELAITPDEAMLFRPDPTDDRSKLLYRFRGGWGDPTSRPRDDTDLPVDLGAFDVHAVAEVLRNAPQTLGINPADVSEVFVDVDHIQDPAGPGALELLVKVSAESGGDGYIYLDSAGNTKRVEYPG